MSDVMADQTEETESTEVPDERSMLMSRARMMGLKFSNNIGLEALKAKIAAHLASEAKVPELVPEPEVEALVEADPTPPAIRAELPKKPLTKMQIREKLMKDALRLIRIRITNMDPKKRDLPGEIITVANKYIGTVRKYVPFGDQTENGYHVPYCIYQFLKERRFLHIQTRKTKRDGIVTTTSYVPEFSIEILPPLTRQEIKRLAVQQAAAAGNES